VKDCLSHPDPALECLETALESLPAYHDWRKLDPGPGAHVDTRYASLPPLTKQDIRRHFPNGFVRPGRNLDSGIASGEIELIPTSGSTGDRVTNVWHEGWWSSAEQASWKLNAHSANLEPGRREAILTSPLCTGVTSRNGEDVPLKERIADRYLYLNEHVDPASWRKAHCERMLDELEEFRPLTLDANPSYLAVLARHATRVGRKPYAPAFIALTYENPSLLHYRQIRQAFTAPLASSYGSTETGYVFMECEHGRMHQNTDYCRVDFQPLKQEHGGPDVGRILVTPLYHPWTILLRFDVGDLVRVARDKCPCGRTDGLTLVSIEGRVVNLTLDTRRRAVTQRSVDVAMAGLKGLVQYRLLQTSGEAYSVSCVTTGQRIALRKTVVAALRRVYGDEARIDVSFESALSPDPPGKYRLAMALFDIPVSGLLDPDPEIAERPCYARTLRRPGGSAPTGGERASGSVGAATPCGDRT